MITEKNEVAFWVDPEVCIYKHTSQFSKSRRGERMERGNTVKRYKEETTDLLLISGMFHGDGSWKKEWFFRFNKLAVSTSTNIRTRKERMGGYEN